MYFEPPATLVHTHPGTLTDIHGVWGRRRETQPPRPSEENRPMRNRERGGDWLRVFHPLSCVLLRLDVRKGIWTLVVLRT